MKTSYQIMNPKGKKAIFQLLYFKKNLNKYSIYRHKTKSIKQCNNELKPKRKEKINKTKKLTRNSKVN